MTIAMTRNFAQGLGIGDYAAKRDMYRGAAHRAERRGWSDQRREHVQTALRYRAIVHAIARTYPCAMREPGIYFVVER